MVKFYTGIPDRAMLMEEILEDDAKTMRLWVGKKSRDYYSDCKPGCYPKFSLWNNFL